MHRLARRQCSTGSAAQAVQHRPVKCFQSSPPPSGHRMSSQIYTRCTALSGEISQLTYRTPLMELIIIATSIHPTRNKTKDVFQDSMPGMRDRNTVCTINISTCTRSTCTELRACRRGRSLRYVTRVCDGPRSASLHRTNLAT